MDNQTSFDNPVDVNAIHHQIIEASPSGMIVVDANQPDMPVVSVNSAFEQTTGYHRDEVIGRNCRFLQRGDRDQPGIAIIRAALKNRTGCETVIRNYRKDGSLFWNELRIAPLHDTEGRVTHFIGIQNDITWRVQAETALAESETRRRLMLEAMPDLIFRIRGDGTFLDYHVPDTDLLYLPPQNFIGQKVADVMPPEFARKSMDLIAEALASGEPRKYDYEMPVGDEVRHFETRIMPTGSDEVLAIARDITDRRRAEAQAFELALEKERSNLLVAFIRNAAHEFRTPLSIISSSAYLMLRSPDHDQRARKAEQIETQVQRTTRLVDMLLHMSRLENLSTLAVEQLSIRTVFESVCASARAAYGDRPSLDLTITPDLPPVMGSQDDLTLALRQILDNAYQFTPAEGRITASLLRVNDHIRFEVCDTGPGIPDAMLPHIFNVFWRQDNTHIASGFGLGLSIARRIIDLHNGHIRIASPAGWGTCVQVDLPVVQPVETPSALSQRA